VTAQAPAYVVQRANGASWLTVLLTTELMESMLQPQSPAQGLLLLYVCDFCVNE
jgi:hypothetical protein